MKRIIAITQFFSFLIVFLSLLGKQAVAQTETTATDVVTEAPISEIAPSNYNRIHDIAYINGDTYFVGTYEDKRLNKYGVSGYWKNGQLFPLTDKSGVMVSSPAMAAAVFNGDLYIIGIQNNDGLYCYTIWKNGIWQKEVQLKLPENEESFYFEEIADLAVSNNDVYILSNNNNTYCWKNGQLMYLNSPIGENKEEEEEMNYKKGTGLLVDKGDVYVVGAVGNYYTKAVYWKNGQCFTLPLPETVKSEYGNVKVSGTASGICSANGNIAISGWYIRDGREVACYWKDGKMFELSPWYAKANTTAIISHGNDIYVAGFMQKYSPEDKEMACYWKNGQLVPVFETDSADLHPAVIDVFLSANNQAMTYLSDKFYSYYNSYNRFRGGDVFTAVGNRLQKIVLEVPDENYFSVSQTQDVEISDEGDVYVLGYEKLAKSDIEKPIYWKNGKKQELSMPANSTRAKAFNIAVEQGEQLILGYHNDTTQTKENTYYCYWRNGKYHAFDTLFTATGSKIANGNVYVIGYKQVYDAKIGEWLYQGVYYMNDKEYKLSIPKNLGYHIGTPATISVANGKVYIAGTVVTYDKSWDKIIKQHAVLWTDGVCTLIPPVNPSYKYYPMQVNTDGAKPEVIGTYYHYYTDKSNKYQYIAGYYTWQPGSPIKPTAIKAPTAEELKLALRDEYSTENYCNVCYSAALFFIDNGQHYALLDIQNQYNVYTQNGKVQPLPLTAGKYGSKNTIHSLTVRNGKAYVGGSYLDNEGNEKACYWLDGKRVELE